MRRIISTSRTVIVVSVLVALMVTGLLRTVRVDAADAPSLVISQIKITSSNGQFVTLYNTTDAELDMSRYQLQYFNSYDLTKATSSRLIPLTGTISPHGYYMVNDDALLLCYRLTVNSTSLGLSSTAGMIELLGFNQAGPGGSITPALQDYVSWSKTTVNGIQTLPVSANAFLRRQPTDATGNPIVGSAGSGSWQSVQPDPANSCGLITTTTHPTNVLSGMDSLLPGSEPPASIINVAAGSSQTAPSLPAADIGLMTPSITELLPNPNGTGNDNSDEFIELYNPNTKPFDLTGFSLQAGLSTTRTFTFPAGTHIQPKNFVAFYAAKTGLTLSNSGSQVKLLDPFGNSINTAGVYGTAKDGQAWALAKGKWYWTAEATPGKANIIKEPATTKKSGSKKTALKAKKASTRTAAYAGASSHSDEEPAATPIHPRTLAIIGGLALLYGAYEYRADLANRFYQLRRNIAARRNSRT